MARWTNSSLDGKNSAASTDRRPSSSAAPANQLTNVTGLEKLTQLEELWLVDNPDLTKAQIDELKKALPNYKINHNPKK